MSKIETPKDLKVTMILKYGKQKFPFGINMTLALDDGELTKEKYERYMDAAKRSIYSQLVDLGVFKA